jgi:flagellar biosynthetic protein FlhB
VAENDAGEKSLDPTQHRREQAREEGQVVQSQDLTSAAMLMLGLALLLWYSGTLGEFFTALLRKYLGGDPWLVADSDFVIGHWRATAWSFSRTMLPLLGLLLLGGIAINLAQVGILFLPNKLAPDLSRLDPMAGMGRIFSLQNLVKLAFGIVKVIIIGAVAYRALMNRKDDLIGLAALDLPQAGLLMWELCIWTCLKIALALLILAILDYFWQRFRFEQDLKMTPQEMREEMRNLQGDPQMVARRRQVQRQAALNRISTAVPKADVVITNPTELAIAIQYDPATMNAPIIVAKGAGVLAARIRKLALESNIPIVERKPLAQALYKDVDVNKPIPSELYAGVAEVLAYVYQLKGKAVPGAA